MVDKELLAQVRLEACLACGKWYRNKIEAHHIVSRGAGGDDSEANVVPLCVLHHAEFHKIGIGRFTEKYIAFEMHLDKHDLRHLLRKKV